MNDDKPIQKDEALTRLLQTWKPQAQLPPRFQEVVWQRIERAERVSNIPVWRLFADWIQEIFAQRTFAAAYVLVFLFVGGGAGYWHASDKTARAESNWRFRYVQTVDPYQMPR